MSRIDLAKLRLTAFIATVSNRVKRIKNASDSPLKPISKYKAGELASALHPKNQRLIITKITDEGPGLKTYELKADEKSGNHSLAFFSAGQYLSVSLKINGSYITRPYSISSSPKEALKGSYTLTIKATGGLATTYIHDNWKVGTRVVTSAPLGTFTYEPLRDAYHVIALCGGSGITPIRSLAHAIYDGNEDADLTILYGSRTIKDAAFTKDIKALESCRKVRLINVLSDEEAEGCEKGFITAELIKKYAPAKEDYSLFICGPQAMYNFLDKETEKLGIRSKFIRRELFGEYKNPEKDGAFPEGIADTFTATVTIGPATTQISVSSHESLLVSMERAGLKPPSRCRSGMCGWCHSKLISGNVYIPEKVDGRRLADKKYNGIHPCVSFPLSDVEILVPPFSE